jgi:transposase
MPRISLKKRKEVIDRWKIGDSQSLIAKRLQISRGSVQQIIKKYRAGYGVEDKHKSGRNRLLNARTERLIERESKKFPMSTANNLRTTLNLHDCVSVDTVKRVLRRYNLFGRIAIRKPSLTSTQKRKRMEWCSQRREWNENNWSKIIFSDECRLELNPRSRQYVRRPKYKKLSSQYVNKTKKFSPSIMVWGAIRSDGRRMLIKCESNVDSVEYQRILSLARSHIYTRRFILQQDGASSHTSASTRQYLLNNSLRTLENWPSQSPDLNIIEQMWLILKENIKKKSPRTVEDLWNIAHKEWMDISNELIEKLYASVPRRLLAVLAAKGGNTKY